MDPREPIITRRSDVVIVQLPFEFENLFTHPLPAREPHQQPVSSQSVPKEALSKQPSYLNDLRLPPKHRRKPKSRKIVQQHLEELNCEYLRTSDDGIDIYCIPCETTLTENGKVKKSTIKLHLACKKHLFYVRQMEFEASNQLPPEIVRGDEIHVYQCTVCKKAISTHLGDVRRHCNGKKHKELLASSSKSGSDPAVVMPIVKNNEAVPADANGSEATDSGSKKSGRDVNREFVDDVLTYLLRTNSVLSSSALKRIKTLFERWSNMRLPDPDSIRRNHLPRFFAQNPELKTKYDSVQAKRQTKKPAAVVDTPGDELEVGQHEEHGPVSMETDQEPTAVMSDLGCHAMQCQNIGGDHEVQLTGEPSDEMQTETVTVTEMELAEAIKALANNGQIFAVPHFDLGSLTGNQAHNSMPEQR